MSTGDNGVHDEQRVVRARRFAQLPEALIDDDRLSALAKLLWAALDRYANSEREAWPSIATLAKRLHVNRRTIERALGDLVDTGWIERHERERPDGGRTSSTIVLLDGLTPATPVSQGGDADVAGPTTGESHAPATPLSHASLNESQLIESQGSRTPARANDVERVWAHWLFVAQTSGLVRDVTRLQLTAGRRSAIAARLRDGYSVEQLLEAVGSALANPHHRSNPAWCDVASIFGSAAKVDRHLSRAQLADVAVDDKLAKAQQLLDRTQAMHDWMSNSA